MAHTQFGLLTTRRYLPLFIVQFLGAFNDNVFKNAFVILLTFRLDAQMGWDPKLGVTIISGIFILPFFLFSALAGQLADKFEKSCLIRWVKLWEVAAMTLAAIGFLNQSVGFLFFVLFMMGAHSTFFGPLKYGILPYHLRSDELVGGNAMIEAATYVAILAGTMLGGFCILAPHGLILVSGLVILIALAGFGMSRHVPQAEPQVAALKVNPNIFGETWHLIAHAWSKPGIYRCILGISWFWVIGATWLTLIPAFVKECLNLGEFSAPDRGIYAGQTVVTGFLTLFAVGIGVGSLLCNFLLKGKTSAQYSPAAALAVSLFTADFVWVSIGLPPTPLVIPSWTALRMSLDLLAIAIAGGIFSVPLYALLQEWSEPAYRARNIAANNVMNALFMVLASVITGVLVGLKWTVPGVFALVAVLNLAVVVYGVRLVPESRLFALGNKIRRK